jgi:NAD(P)-dependent dehydrogenase (short-subunit alcohol dehydrogenase family)
MTPVTNMSDNVALITGGAKGIGHGIALDLAARQWREDRSGQHRGRQTAEERAILFHSDRRHAAVTRKTAEDTIGLT